MGDEVSCCIIVDKRNWKKKNRTMRALKELWLFIRSQKKWWITPIVIFLFALSGLIILTESSAIAPFIYSIF